MTLALPIYPDETILPGLAYGSHWSPRFVNMPTATAANGAEIDTALAQYPLHDFELIYNYLSDVGETARDTLEFRTMMGFVGQIGGVAGRFLYTNPDDNQVHQQLLGVGDGATGTFTFVRFFGAMGYGWSEPVGAVDTDATLNLYLGDSATPLSASLYELDTSNAVEQTVNFASPPAAGIDVRADFGFFYYCKFTEDVLDFQKLMDRIWSLGSVKIHSCRPGA